MEVAGSIGQHHRPRRPLARHPPVEAECAYLGVAVGGVLLLGREPVEAVRDQLEWPPLAANVVAVDRDLQHPPVLAVAVPAARCHLAPVRGRVLDRHAVVGDR